MSSGHIPPEEAAEMFWSEIGEKAENPTDIPVAERRLGQRLLWCSEPDWEEKEVINYYSDKLYLVHIDDGLFALELHCGGTVTRLPITNNDKYLI